MHAWMYICLYVCMYVCTYVCRSNYIIAQNIRKFVGKVFANGIVVILVQSVLRVVTKIGTNYVQEEKKL
jgi:hypothetical protein